MKLISENPFWAVCNGLLASYPSLHEDVKCDCVVVGGGITGALVAYHLVEAGLDTVLLDKRDIGTGSTSGSTGLLQYEVDVPLRQLRKQVGGENAERSYLLCREAIGKLSVLVRRLGIPCGFERKPSLQIARYRKEIPGLREEHSLRRALGLKVEFWVQAQLAEHFPFTRPCALYSQEGAQVDPHALTHGLLAAAAERGLRVFDRTDVTSFQPTSLGINLNVAKGPVVKARRAVIAAGFEAKNYLGTAAGRLKSTYALISEPVPQLGGWHRESLIWETGLPYLYLRTLPDKRIIVGGEDEDFINPARRDALITAKARTLKRKFSRLFPEIELEEAYSWAGTFGETKDGLPYIGSHSSLPHAYFALGYGGNGITYSLIAAEILRDLLRGRRNRDAEIFAFDR
jgi:glycine/D-amino acid oxidase-like deaminating enzyme